MTAVEIGRRVGRPSLTAGAVAAVPGELDSFASSYPNLLCFLAKSRENGTPYETGTITVFYEAGAYKLCLNDRPAKRSAFLTGKALADVLRAADKALWSDTVQWRTKGYRSR